MREKCILNQNIINERLPLERFTPLMSAACYGRCKMIELFINYVADVDAINNYGETALSIVKAKKRFYQESQSGQLKKIDKYDKCIALLKQAQLNKEQ